MKTEIENQRKNHHKSLESICANGTTGLALWRKLARLETEARSAATAQCNGSASGGQPFRDEKQWEQYAGTVSARVGAIMGGIPAGFHFNSDPRGCALKLDGEAVHIPDGMVKDWGGYGILAPTIN